MSMSNREGERQADLWIPTAELARSPGLPFYERLNRVLAEAGCRSMRSRTDGRASRPGCTSGF